MKNLFFFVLVALTSLTVSAVDFKQEFDVAKCGPWTELRAPGPIRIYGSNEGQVSFVIINEENDTPLEVYLDGVTIKEDIDSPIFSVAENSGEVVFRSYSSDSSISNDRADTSVNTPIIAINTTSTVTFKGDGESKLTLTRSNGSGQVISNGETFNNMNLVFTTGANIEAYGGSYTGAISTRPYGAEDHPEHDIISTITIEDGRVLAFSGYKSGDAAIGCGQRFEIGVVGQEAHVVINGGTVIAKGGALPIEDSHGDAYACHAAAIGGGVNGDGSVVINGGTVNASIVNPKGGEPSDIDAPAIGYCQRGNGSVTINGGTVTVLNEGSGAGIGKDGFYDAYPGQTEIYINGGIVNVSAEGGEAIGGSKQSVDHVVEKLEINGGTVNIGKKSQGIGQINKISITGGTITAPYIRSIGGSTSVTSGSIFITDDNDPVFTYKDKERSFACTLPDAMAPTTSSIFGVGEGEDVTFNTTKASESEFTYSYTGTGHEDTYNLYFYLPDGSYTVSGSNGKTFNGTVNDGPAEFTLAPEPGIAALALIALAALLRRK